MLRVLASQWWARVEPLTLSEFGQAPNQLGQLASLATGGFLSGGYFNVPN